jgi:hypothetical protein
MSEMLDGESFPELRDASIASTAPVTANVKGDPTKQVAVPSQTHPLSWVVHAPQHDLQSIWTGRIQGSDGNQRGLPQNRHWPAVVWVEGRSSHDTLPRKPPVEECPTLDSTQTMDSSYEPTSGPTPSHLGLKMQKNINVDVVQGNKTRFTGQMPKERPVPFVGYRQNPVIFAKMIEGHVQFTCVRVL